MTNNDIIARYKLEKGIPLDTQLHTYEAWKKLGYKVKKGEKSEHKITIWKYSVKIVEDKDTGEEKKVSRCFPKLSAFFSSEQVEKIDKENKND